MLREQRYASQEACKRLKSHVRPFDALTDFDCVREHALDTIDPGDQIARSGWVDFL
jgi:hypothetical protein